MTKQSTWDVNWPVIPDEDRAVFESRSSLMKAPAEVITRDNYSGVSKLSLRSDYYVKTYSGRGERLKQLLGISRFHREQKNLRYFSELGLATPAIAASGHHSRLGFLLSGTLVTVGVGDSLTLEQLLESGAFYASGRPAARQLLDQLAHALRLLHQRGFFHRDLKTRNILVRGFGARCELFFFDCPSGHHPPAFRLPKCVMRDLAYLERGLRGHLRKVDLLYLSKAYRDCEKLSDEDKALGIATLNYYGQRRMTRKRKMRAARRNSAT